MARRRQDLTYSDWVQVFDYWDKHPQMSQTAIMLEGGKLLFKQPALSKKTKQKDKIRALVATAEPNIFVHEASTSSHFPRGGQGSGTVGAGYGAEATHRDGTNAHWVGEAI
ncbi:hypothetical protein B0H14DRAFT_2561524 [Mycena olivaceomarginata]|nr:hypothetical protein B0H14DRAFT_2561524 [Mycena olivaceomarginata]